MERHTRSYLQLMKPGITLSNTISAIAGFLLAVSVVMPSWPVLWQTALGVICGTALIIASACVVNNVLDRGIDKRMKRTAKREVASGSIRVPQALAYAAALGVAGFALLFFLTNFLTFMLGVIAYVWYVAIYGYAKRTTSYSTLIGGVAGSLPPMAGYTALTGSIDIAAILLFVILFCWQMPHFYAIAMFRRDDYASAKLPVWSVAYGMKSTKAQIFVFTALYAISAALLTFFGYTGIIYLVLSAVLSIYWLYKGASTYTKLDDVKWAKMMFGISLLVLLATCAFIALGGFLP
jgi:protoheme IX farnesyltransferase